MFVEIIESLENKKVKYWKKLNMKKYRDSEGKFLVEGEHLVNEALKSGLLIEVIKTCDYNFTGNCDVYEVSYDILKKISNTIAPQPIIGVCRTIPEKEINNQVLILDDIQDPGNLGTIIRSACAFGIDTIIASPNTVDVYNAKVLRSSEGMVFHINYIIADLKNSINELKDKYTIYTTNVQTGKNIRDIKVITPYAIILGNEGRGVSSKLSSLADETLYIPISDVCESLNVAIATSIILYEFNK